jgi:hypothetical protein
MALRTRVLLPAYRGRGGWHCCRWFCSPRTQSGHAGAFQVPTRSQVSLHLTSGPGPGLRAFQTPILQLEAGAGRRAAVPAAASLTPRGGRRRRTPAHRCIHVPASDGKSASGPRAPTPLPCGSLALASLERAAIKLRATPSLGLSEPLEGGEPRRNPEPGSHAAIVRGA